MKTKKIAMRNNTDRANASFVIDHSISIVPVMMAGKVGSSALHSFRVCISLNNEDGSTSSRY